MKLCNNPEISVLITVFNGSKYLELAIKSILNQTFSNFELIIVDDGSDDNSFHIISEFAKKDCRLIPYSIAHQGISAAANFGLDICKGKYIARMDSDDWSFPYRLEKQYHYMENNINILASSGVVVYVDDMNSPLGYNNPYFDHKDIIDELLKGRGSALVNSCVVMRKDAVLKVGGYNTKYARSEDLDLFLRLSEIGHLSNINELLLKFVRHETSFTASYEDKLASDIRDQEIVDNYCKRNGILKNPNKIYGTISNRSVSEYHSNLAFQAFNSYNYLTGYNHVFRALKKFKFYKSTFACLHRALCYMCMMKFSNKIKLEDLMLMEK